MEPGTDATWKTKPTDRFILRWVKCTLSARITPRVAAMGWVRPWMLTLTSTGLGCLAGLVYACGWGFTAGVFAALSQVLDGVDGQLARLTNRESRGGAFLDSVLDRYADGALVMGLTLYNVRMHGQGAGWVLLLGALALIGSSQISYTSARAETLSLPMGPPTLASKGTRTVVTSLCALLSPVGAWIPLVGLLYLALHTTGVVIRRILLVSR